jgi:hypothetical protein
VGVSVGNGVDEGSGVKVAVAVGCSVAVGVGDAAAEDCGISLAAGDAAGEVKCAPSVSDSGSGLTTMSCAVASLQPATLPDQTTSTIKKDIRNKND